MLTAILKLNMSMPESCHGCPFAEWEYINCKCTLTQKKFEDCNRLTYKRPKFCPLREREK